MITAVGAEPSLVRQRSPLPVPYQQLSIHARSNRRATQTPTPPRMPVTSTAAAHRALRLARAPHHAPADVSATASAHNTTTDRTAGPSAGGDESGKDNPVRRASASAATTPNSGTIEIASRRGDRPGSRTAWSGVTETQSSTRKQIGEHLHRDLRHLLGAERRLDVAAVHQLVAAHGVRRAALAL